MKNLKAATFSTVLIIAIILQVRWPAPTITARASISQGRVVQASSPGAESGTSSVYLPTIIKPPGLPDFEIIQPRDGWDVSGMMYFAAQATDPQTLSSVTFMAGSTELGTDSTPEDGYQVFFDASDYPAGSLQLSAVGSGPSGEKTQTITVNVIPNPPSSGVVGAQGGVFASEIGSILTFPPGSVPDGTSVTVEEKTQEEITQQNGFDWDAMGVTFLGAQVITSSAPISLPLGIASAGFGPRVQPGQVVVNYNILPDANGDGVDELVVVNTASVAPNDDVISDPVPQLALVSEEVSSSALNLRNLNDGISGPPGTFFEINAVGFNPFSALGTVAVYHSSVDDTEFWMSAAIVDGFGVGDAQTILTMIPSLPPGPATLELRNESTGSAIGPFDITVEVPAPLMRPAEEIIDEFLVSASGNLDVLDNTLAGEAAFSQAIAFIDSAKNEISELRPLIMEMSNDPEAEELLVDMAVLLENSAGFTSHLELESRLVSRGGGLCENKEQYLEAVKPSIFDAIDLQGIAGDALDYFAKQSLGAALGAGFGAWVSSVFDWLTMVTTMSLVIIDCNLYGPPPPQSINSSPLFFEGMGSTPPMGGSGVGNAPTPPANGGTSSLRLQSSTFDQAPGRVIVKAASSGGGGFPFSGATDASGYFFIPLIPQGEPFVATAIDTLTGQMRTFEGVGPAIGESVIMSFDFFSGDSGGVTELQFGEVISASIDSPTEIDTYSFQGTAGDGIFLRMKGLWNISDPDCCHYPAFEVYRPDGTLLCSNPPSGVNLLEEMCALDATGTYTLLYSDYTSSHTGSYQLHLQRTNPPAMATGIGFGETITGTLDFLVDLGAHTFGGSTGDQVLFRMSEASSSLPLQPKFWVFGPDGTLLCEAYSTSKQVEEVCVLEASGTHSILAGGWAAQSVSPYALYIQRLNNPSQVMLTSFGEVVSGTLDLLAKADTYGFDGTSGDQVIIRMARTATLPSGVTFWPKFRLYGEDGSELCSDFSPSLAEAICALDATGSYTILASNSQGIGSYNLFLQRTNNPTGATTITYGETLIGTIAAAAEQDAYTFSGTADSQMYFRMTGVSGNLDPKFSVYRPDGTLLCSAQNGSGPAEATCTLDSNGSHTILAGDLNGTRSGNYQIFIDLN